MTTAPKKAPSKKKRSKAPAKRASRGAAKVELTPVTPKIGEPSGNLAARAAAFQRRRGSSGKGD